MSLVDAFGEAAMSWGMESDRGIGRRVKTAKESYNETKITLKQYIQRLKNQIKRLKQAAKATTVN